MPQPVDVLIVGAGPTGLTLAGELLRRGLRTRIIDKLAAPTPHSRALGVHARTLEIFDDLGIADELIARGVRVRGATMRTAHTTIANIDFDDLDTRFPFILCVSQVETEAVLAGLLARRGGTVERDRELVSLRDDGTGVDVVLRTPSGEDHVRASWIVGCDGAHSTVRHALGIGFEGHTYEDTFALADVHLDWDVPGDRVTTYFAEDGAAAFFPISHGRWRVIATAAEALGDHPTLDAIRALVERRAGRTIALRDPVWLAAFRIHCRQTERYRHGRAFLAGDAAHIHSPIGGQGMNTGIQDAHNLAWKLALVARGQGRDELLDSYSAERHAIGKHVLAQTDVATRLGTVKGLLVPVRNQVMRFIASFEPVRRRIARDAAELTVAYAHSPIVDEHTSSTLAARLGKVGAAETPTLGSRIDFAGGPRPGGRALDGAVSADGATAATLLSRVCGGHGFTLLLFDGRSSTAPGYAALVAIARRVRDRFGNRVATFVVTPRADRPVEIPTDIAVLHDTAGELEARYAARTECVYLVRPDLYISFRSQPAHGDALEAHLAKILT